MKKRLRTLSTLIGLCLGGVVLSSPGYAEEAKSLWSFETGLYVFLPAEIDGTSTIDGAEVDWDLGYEEIYELFDFSGAGRFEGWRDLETGKGNAIGFIVDAQYLSLGYDTRVSGGTVDIDIRQSIADVMIGYKFPSMKFGMDSGQSLTFTTSAGLRYNYRRQSYDVPSGLPAPFDTDLKKSEAWFEPVIGAQGRFKLSERWDLNLHGDISGFNIDEGIAWSVTGTAAWQIVDNTFIRIGYRVYDADYSIGSGNNEFGFDGTTHGPVIGASYKF